MSSLPSRLSASPSAALTICSVRSSFHLPLVNLFSFFGGATFNRNEAPTSGLMNMICKSNIVEGENYKY